MRLEFGKIVDERVDEILEARGMAPASAADAIIPTLPNRSRAPAKEHFKPVKTATCRKEKENLEQIQNIHKYPIQHFATCEKGKIYYVIFPWADGGNLRELWTSQDSRQRTPELALWSLQQILGLVGALKALHNVNCRHGDLKPENILYFKEDGEGTLVIADVGLSRVHEMETKMRHAGTITQATTPEVFRRRG
ncbi:hypothetical protein G7Y89_g11066 [Cudoniella acicularis]|uniref:Protein kinase domain-containing protein n=1 Tax=Cudoniella acicularis TaxID=354080 RepID=A0A8H4W0E7_9HELO|nr:hypothetical protein G7Y89_g11066 [Cudoniella acicularis]